LVVVLNVIVTVAAVGTAYRTVSHADDSERLVIPLMAAEDTMRPLVDRRGSAPIY
jgi:hypothetical protein